MARDKRFMRYSCGSGCPPYKENTTKKDKKTTLKHQVGAKYTNHVLINTGRRPPTMSKTINRDINRVPTQNTPNMISNGINNQKTSDDNIKDRNTIFIHAECSNSDKGGAFHPIEFIKERDTNNEVMNNIGQKSRNDKVNDDRNVFIHNSNMETECIIPEDSASESERYINGRKYNSSENDDQNGTTISVNIEGKHDNFSVNIYFTE